MFSLLESKRIQEWYADGHKNDVGAVEPRPFPFDLIVKDEKFEEYGNREVNLGQDISTERGADFIIIDTEKMKFTNDQELKFKFSKDSFF